MSLQALTPAQAFANGTLTADNGDGEPVEFPAKGDPSVPAGQYVRPTAITVEGDTYDFSLSKTAGNVTIRYYAGSLTGTPVAYDGFQETSLSSITRAEDYAWEAGTYVAKVTYHDADSQMNGAEKTFTFSVADVDLANATLFNATDGNKDVEKDSFTYNAKKQTVGLAVDGTVLSDSKDYDVVIVQGTTQVSTDGTLTNSGDYTVNVYKNGGAATDAPVKSIPLSVAKLDLSKAAISISDTDSDDPTSVISCTVDGVVLANQTTAEYTPNNDGVKITVNASGTLADGAYTAKVEPVNDDQFNVTGSQTVTFNKVGEVVDDSAFQYDGKPMDGKTLKVDLSKPRTTYDEDLIEVAGVDEGDYDIWYTDDEGNDADAADLQTTGTWKVNLRVNAARTQFAQGSDTVIMTVVVVGGVVEDSDVVFKYNGEVTGDLTGAKAVTYDGTDVLDDIEVTVRSDGKTLTEGTDYTLKVVNTDTNEEVDGIVDAGSYSVTVESEAYDLSSVTDATLEIEVEPVTPTSVAVVPDLTETTATGSTQGYLAYTGDVLTPSFTFKDGDDEVEVPAEAYEVTYDMTKDADGNRVTKKDVELKEAGTYTATFETAKGVKNYDLEDATLSCEIVVTTKRVFLDVPMNEWYSEAVYTAAKNGFMNGDGGGRTFSPMRELTRAEAACVLFNMAGGDAKYGNLPGYNEYTGTYETGFSDVAGSEFFAKAVAWAKTTGVINGYADGTFGVSRKVTNEEFACMLANYAKAKGDYKAVDADEVLAAYPDASVVSDWAEDAVAWCVSQEIMGGGANISPAGSILRMRAATMAVNAQPEKADDALIEIPGVNDPAEAH